MDQERASDSGAPVQPAPAPATAVALLSRELALLEFNRRLLAQAERVDVPLLERLRYVTIVSSNMDEFFEVRFTDYLEAVRATGTAAARSELEALSVFGTNWK